MRQTTTVKISRFKPSGKWYDDFELSFPIAMPDPQTDVKGHTTASYELHKAIRQEWESRNDGFFWLHADERTFPVLHVPDAHRATTATVSKFPWRYHV